MAKLILASSSQYRQSLLSRLKLDFESYAPDIDETALQGEAPVDLVKRLSIKKAQTISELYPEKYILGSDQVAVFENKIIGKPLNEEAAFSQLSEFSGNKVLFITGVALVNKNLKFCKFEISKVSANFRPLSARQITNYLKVDKPFDCAGSFKVEQFGISLFNSVQSDDPTSLEGLPLIKVCSLLKGTGLLID